MDDEEKQNFKFMVEIMRRDQFSIVLYQWCSTFAITIFYSYIGFNFFHDKFKLCLYLNLFDDLSSNSRFLLANKVKASRVVRPYAVLISERRSFLSIMPKANPVLSERRGRG